MHKQIRFEDIRTRYKEYADRIRRFGTDQIIQTQIPWEKVAWGRTIGNHQIFPFFREKSPEGTPQLFFMNEGGLKQTMSKRDFAYMYDFWDKDGNLLHIAFLGF